MEGPESYISCQSNDTESPTYNPSTGFSSERLFVHELDRLYVEKHTLTETDMFLEQKLGSLTGDFRVWHIIFIACAVMWAAVVAVCCFVRFRIPRTKAEIEANSKRRQLLKNFKLKLKNLKAAELDDMDYRRALERLREEFKADNESLAQSEAISIMSLVDDLPNDDDEVNKDKDAGDKNAAKANGAAVTTKEVV